MMSQHSNNATAAILVHNENLVRVCTKMAAVSIAKGCMQTLYCNSALLMQYNYRCSDIDAPVVETSPQGYNRTSLEDSCKLSL